jgi:hypothetical protein
MTFTISFSMTRGRLALNVGSFSSKETAVLWSESNADKDDSREEVVAKRIAS